MELKDILTQRRSVRKFSDKAVEHDKIERILKQTLKAPSSRNSRSTRLWVTEDKALLEHIAQMRDYGAAFVRGASAAVLVMGDSAVSDLWEVNCAISATTLQLAVVDEGLASCWVHVAGRPCLKDEPEGRQAEEHLREKIALPESYRVLCVIALGYSDFEPAALPPYNGEQRVKWL